MYTFCLWHPLSSGSGRTFEFSVEEPYSNLIRHIIEDEFGAIFNERHGWYELHDSVDLNRVLEKVCTYLRF